MPFHIDCTQKASPQNGHEDGSSGYLSKEMPFHIDCTQKASPQNEHEDDWLGDLSEKIPYHNDCTKKGFSPEWTRRWFIRLPFWSNAFPHSLHAKGFSTDRVGSFDITATGFVITASVGFDKLTSCSSLTTPYDYTSFRLFKIKR